MKLKELKRGTVFNIENTPSYPKLKVEDGYVDIRDNIKNTFGSNDERTVYIMTDEDVGNKLGHPADIIGSWINDLRKQYIK